MILCAQMSRLANNSPGDARSAAMTKNGGDFSAQSSVDPSTFINDGDGDDINQPNLNILNQASNISQLSANNTSFDPSQLVVNSNEGQMSHQQQADGVITAFSGLVVQSSNDNGSSAAVVTTTTNGMNNLRVSPPPLQPQHMPMQVQQLVQTTTQTVPIVSPPSGSVLVQQAMPVVTHHQSQMSYQNNTSHHVQPLQPKPMQNGRVPATKHDNRKLFVGGLPNEGE
jgi:hypothetical protein